ncbi:hypothetical protein [Sinorhizobium terangae]|uniref:hypothetical protein n=1 Tax=Sinorhizobium terangae TaxID=110322 RepID=UPI0024B1AAE6|nr:hypothetical protein [Sinorhizobium terangae]WFU49168.1 hypothetical protein QA637_07155 [Sinorhizobium terangae]
MVETVGDIIAYHDGLTKSVVLAYATCENHVNDFARLGSVHSVADLAALGLVVRAVCKKEGLGQVALWQAVDLAEKGLSTRILVATSLSSA